MVVGVGIAIWSDVFVIVVRLCARCPYGVNEPLAGDSYFTILVWSSHVSATACSEFDWLFHGVGCVLLDVVSAFSCAFRDMIYASRNKGIVRCLDSHFDCAT